eukprot:Gb_19907 [translate_table: standard]
METSSLSDTFSPMSTSLSLTLFNFVRCSVTELFSHIFKEYNWFLKDRTRVSFGVSYNFFKTSHASFEDFTL